MSVRDQTDSGQLLRLGTHLPVPAARPLSDFAAEEVGDDLVILDCETMQYHTLNLPAFTIWKACDGVASTAEIARALDLPVELVESTVGGLGEAGLLESPSSEWDATLSRRRAAKLIAAGLVGVVGLPVVKSITAPESASAQTPCRPRGSSCTSTSQCCNGGSFGISCNGGVCCSASSHSCGADGQCCSGCCSPCGICQATDNGNCMKNGGVCVASTDEEPVEIDVESVSDASFTDEQRSYLGDENGDVSVEAIQSQDAAVDAPVEVPADSLVQDEAPADAAPADNSSGSSNSTESNSGATQPVETSSGEQEAPTDEANG